MSTTTPDDTSDLAKCDLCGYPLNLKRALRLMRQWRDAGVPLGCRIRDSRRRELLSMPRCRPRETGSGFDALPFDGPETVERPTPMSSATSRVLYSPLCTSETGCASWRRLSLGRLQPALGLRDLRALAGPEPDQIGLELGDHG